MTIEQYSDNIKKLAEISNTKAIESILIPAANRLLANTKNRVQLEKENTAGGKIGNYSTKPMYATRDMFVKKSAFKPIGKNNFTGKKLVSAKKYKVVKVKLKDGRIVRRVVSENKYNVVKKKPKSMYLPNGYYQLRAIQGRPVDGVNLTYTGDLMASYQMQKATDAILLGLVSEREKQKRLGLEKRFGGQLLHPSKSGIADYGKEVTKGVQQIISKIIKSGTL